MTKEQEKRAEKGKNCLITLAAAFGGGCLLGRDEDLFLETGVFIFSLSQERL